MATCPGAATFPATPPQPAVASIDVLPAMLQLRAPATSAALLEARPRDAEGFEIAEVFGVPLNWSVSTGPLTSGVPAPRLFRIALPASTSSPGSANVQATVSSGVQGGPADVQYALQSVTSPMSEWPRVAIADFLAGSSKGDPVQPMAFVGELVPGDDVFWGDTWESVLFLNPGGGPTMYSPETGPPKVKPSEVIDASHAQAPVIQVPVAVWFAAASQQACGSVAQNDHVAWATEAYQRARAGMVFAVGDQVDLTPSPETAEAVNEYCENFLDTMDPPALADAMNVYFVEKGGPAGGILDIQSGKRAIACIPANKLTSASVLAHELGHALDLHHISLPPTPPPPKRSGDDPLSAVNVMSQYVVSTRDTPHHRFLLGQVFRVLVSKASWIVQQGLVGWAGLNCPGDCPDVLLDVEVAP